MKNALDSENQKFREISKIFPIETVDLISIFSVDIVWKTRIVQYNLLFSDSSIGALDLCHIELDISQETQSACSDVGDSQETIPYTDDMGLRIRLILFVANSRHITILIVSKDRFWWSEKNNFYSSYDPCYAYIASSQSDCEIVDDLPELYSHNYVPDAEPAPYGSSCTEEQEEECQEGECQEGECQEEEGRTQEENVHFEANPCHHVNLFVQVIRKQVPPGHIIVSLIMMSFYDFLPSKTAIFIVQK